MRVVLQRVSEASVTIDGQLVNEIQQGYLLLVGIVDGDTAETVEKMAAKVHDLRIFEDENGKMNLSLKDIEGEILAVSQFTLYGDARKGRRPSFSDAARPEIANPLYEEFVQKVKDLNINVGTGKFGAHMMVDLTNDGPVTILLESRKEF